MLRRSHFRTNRCDTVNQGFAGYRKIEDFGGRQGAHVPTARSVTPCSPPSRRGLETPERRPGGTTASPLRRGAGGGLPPTPGGAQKRGFWSDKRTRDLLHAEDSTWHRLLPRAAKTRQPQKAIGTTGPCPLCGLPHLAIDTAVRAAIDIVLGCTSGVTGAVSHLLLFGLRFEARPDLVSR